MPRGRMLPFAVRCLRLAVSSALALIALAMTPSASRVALEIDDALADASEIKVGSRLVALEDVELDAAVVRAGSAVSVVGRKARAELVLVDVALPDGHVVRGIPLGRIRRVFRVV